MTTFVGTQSKIEAALQDLVELDYDAIEAYDTAIARLENKTLREKLTEFKKDHERHVLELARVLKNHDADVPMGPDMTKHWLAKGKVFLSNLLGDSSILSAMKSNEEDTVSAYERMTQRQDKWDDVIEVLKKGLEDERRHKAWLEEHIK